MYEKAHTSIARWVAPDAAVVKDVSQASEEAQALFGGRAIGRRPPRRGTEELLRAYSEIPQLRAIVQRISESFASVRWTVHRAVGPGGRSIRSRRLERMSFVPRQKEFKRLEQEGRLEEIEDDPFLDLMERGNDVLTGFESRQVMESHLELKGEAFAWLERNPLGMPVCFWPMPPTWIRDIPSLGNPFFTIRFPAGSERQVMAQDVLFIRDPNPADPYGRGTGIGESLGDELDTSEYISAFLKAFFYNDASPSFVVAFPQSESASAEDIKLLEVQWMEKHRGANRGHVGHFLNKKPEITQFSQSFKDMSVVDLQRFMRDVTRETWGVPPEIMGQIENSNRATIDAASAIFAIWILVPRCERWRIAMQTQVAPQFDERKIIGYESPVPEDSIHNLEVAKAQPSARTKNEWRGMQGLDDDEIGGNVYLQPATVIAVPAGAPPPPPPVSPPQKGAQTKQPGINQEDINRVLMDLDAGHLREPVEDLWPDELRKWGDGVMADVGADVSFDMLNPITTLHIEQLAGEHIDWIDDTTRDALRAQLVEGVELGEGYRDLAKRVGLVFTDAETWRTKLIARTETLRSANFATFQAHKTSGVVEQREWIATPDSRVREQHLAMDGQIRDIDKPFQFPDGTVTMYPGESGVARHDCNERCTTAAHFPESETRSEAERRALGQEFHGKVTKWEKKAAAGFRRGFKKQRADVQNQLRIMSERLGRA